MVTKIVIGLHTHLRISPQFSSLVRGSAHFQRHISHCPLLPVVSWGRKVAPFVISGWQLLGAEELGRSVSNVVLSAACAGIARTLKRTSVENTTYRCFFMILLLV